MMFQTPSLILPEEKGIQIPTKQIILTGSKSLAENLNCGSVMYDGIKYLKRENGIISREENDVPGFIRNESGIYLPVNQILNNKK